MKTVVIKDIVENKSPKFVKTELVKAERDGEPFVWERIKSHDSVHVLIDNMESGEIIVVEQVRVPVLCNDDSQGGRVTEACAGLVDKNKDIKQIVKEEILEECGFDVPMDNIKFLKTLKSSVGTAGTESHTFIAEVTNDMQVSEGGGLAEEDINVVHIRYEDINDYFFNSDIHTDAITMFLVTFWMLYHTSMD